MSFKIFTNIGHNSFCTTSKNKLYVDYSEARIFWFLFKAQYMVIVLLVTGISENENMGRERLLKI